MTDELSPQTRIWFNKIYLADRRGKMYITDIGMEEAAAGAG